MDPLTLECLIHDLNNVFQTLGDAGELLATDPKWAPLAAAISRSVQQGNGILASLAEPQPPSAVRVADLLSNAIQFSRDCLGASRIQFVAVSDPNLEIWVTEGCMERALVNLLLNAAQAMPLGGEVEIRAKPVANRIEISIADHGPGIPEEIVPKVFKPHFTTRAAHSGLGLHIAETIIGRNRGTVVAANRNDGPGAIFTVSLPAAGQVQRLSAGGR